ncbi:hypothetical protein EXS65_04445 [Candidatus Peribacteria bacterium]|nr:hypothetical protein [Candidatus Peribacteria bacterium]
MKKLISMATGAVGSSMFYVGQAVAALSEPDSISGLSTEVGTSGVRRAIVKVITTILDFILIVAVVYVIVAGIRLIVSGGDEGEKDKAKTTIIYVIIGIIVVLLARVIVTFVNNLV